jgi:hypothetical protein
MIGQQLRTFSWLIGFGGLALLAGSWEIASRGRPDQPAIGATPWFVDADPSYSQFVRQRYPASRDAEFLRGVQAGWQWRDPPAAREHFQHAIDAGLKHTEEALYFYVLLLLHQNADAAEIDAAIDQWLENYPHSAQPIIFPYARFQRSDAEAVEAARAALRSVPGVVADSVRVDSGSLTIELRLRGRKVPIAAIHAALRGAGFVFANDQRPESRFQIGLP